MMVVAVDIDKIKIRRSRDIKPRMERATRAGLEQMGREWHDRYLLLHFEESAYRRYNYRARVGQRANRDSQAFRNSYTGRKLRAKKHTKPLVYSGRSMMESQFLRLRSTRNYAKVVLSRGFNRRHPDSQINMRDEVTRVLPSEAALLRRVAAETIKKHLKASRS